MPSGPTSSDKRRARLALLLSVNLHLWIFVSLGLVWWTDQEPKPEPEIIEVLRIVLPAPPAAIEGQSVESAALQRPEPKLKELPLSPIRSPIRPPARVFRQEPELRWSFKVAEPGSEKTQPPLHLVDSRDLAHCLAEQQRHRERPSLKLVQKQDPPPEDLPFHAHDGADASNPMPRVMDKPGGSQLALFDIIQRRIDAISPLVHRTAIGCRALGGQARIRFLMNAQGYPLGYQVLDSSGSPCLDAEIDTVLHMAEPYPRVAGWIPVRVTFRGSDTGT
ncbi:MAG: hypothetical protein JRF33_25025 [Deltaproteobacteria bacterium]|nr:hypothetical protein [Deltaproteobacteria bacterium]